VSLPDVLNLISERLALPVTLVAIEGHSAAGKTSLAKVVAESFSDVTVIHMDDFYRVMNVEERERLDARRGYELYYDWQRLEQDVLKPLSQGQAGSYQCYEWTSNKLSDETVTVEPRGIVIVEGCYSARPELRHYYHATFLVETSAEKRLERQRERANASDEWLEKWDAAERYYMKHHQPQSYVDLIAVGA
jgi:uridine kinase